MTKQTEVLKLALDAICGSGDFLFNWHECEPNNEREMQRYQETLEANEKDFNAIREALAEQPAIKQDLTPEPAQQESLKDLWHKVWPDAGAFVRVSADDLTQFAKAVSTPPQPAQGEKK